MKIQFYLGINKGNRGFLEGPHRKRHKWNLLHTPKNQLDLSETHRCIIIHDGYKTIYVISHPPGFPILYGDSTFHPKWPWYHFQHQLEDGFDKIHIQFPLDQEVQK